MNFNKLFSAFLILAVLLTPGTGFAGVTNFDEISLGGGTSLTTTNRTGTGNLVLATTPTLVTPVLGVATATSINISGVTILDGSIDIGTVTTFVDADTTPDVTGSAYWKTNTTGVTITDFDGAGLADGQIITIISSGAIVYDVTSSGLIGGSTDLTTATTDLTQWIYNGTDWYLIQFTDQSDNLA